MNENDNYDSDYDSYYTDSDYDNDDIYEPEEPSRTKYTIVLCRFMNLPIFVTQDKNKYVYRNEDYHLVEYRLKKYDTTFMNDMIHKFNTKIKNPTYFMKFEIAQSIYLQPEEYCIGILKTFWIKIIQRVWKKIYALKMNRAKMSILRNREITLYSEMTPGLRGMLSNLA